MIRRTIARTLVLTLAVGTLAAAASPAVAAPLDDVETTAGLVAAAVPAGEPEIVDTTPAGGSLRVEGEGATTVVGVDPAQPITLTADEGGRTIDVSLPREVSLAAAEQATDGTLVFAATDGGTAATAQVVEDGSVRLTTVIPDATAPHRYTYDLALPADSTVTIEENGSASFVSAEGEWLGGAAVPWAKDARGVDVPTHFVAEGDALVQVVDLTGVTAFPVVADPYLGIALISSVKRINRSEGVTISVVPTAWGRANGNNPTAVNSLVDEYGSKVANAYYTTQMIWQLGCHAQFAPFKSEWNLDAWRYRSSYASYIANKCN